MQSKGSIRFLAIAFAVVCIFQLSFTLITYNVEKNAKSFANGDSKKEKIYLDSLMSQPVYNLLLKKYTYRECKEREINLGLDLKGGMNVTLEVSMAELVKAMSNFSIDKTFNEALLRATEMQKSSQEDYVTLFGRAYKSIDANARLAGVFNTLDLKDRIKYESTNDEVLAVIKEEANKAIDRSFNILRTRIDKFGVTQPSIQKLGVSGRILIELPGVNEPERVRKLLQGTANLEFWETFDNSEVYNYFMTANKKVAALRKGITSTDSTKKDTTQVATVVADVKDSTKKTDLLNKLGGQTTSLAGKVGDTKALNAKDTFALNNPLFAKLTIPSYPSQGGGARLGEGPVVGWVRAKDTSSVSEMLKTPEVASLLPKNLKLVWSVKNDKRLQAPDVFDLVALKVRNRDGRPAMDGSKITDARGEYGQGSSRAEVNMQMNGEGAMEWKRLTGENVKKSIAIVLDNYAYSWPVVNGEIAGGSSQISGDFTLDEAKDLSNILKAGKMPAPARIVSEAIVGPSLGKESIDAGFASFVIALVLVLLFMGLYYSKAGWVADVALFANVFFIMGVLASMGAVLTLPGIAGIVLTIGLSVDANILIFERIREELAEGNAVGAAVREGYKQAMSSIIDSNVTTLILGIILYSFGTGPIQGFATTLIIGILTSLFSAIFISRLIFESMLDRNKPISFATSYSQNAFKNLKFNFVGNRSKYYLFSGSIIVLGVIFFFIHGLNFGIDFKGGRTYIVKFEKSNISTTEVREKLSTYFGGLSPEVKTFGGNNKMKITTTYLIDDTALDADNKVETKLFEGLSVIDKAATKESSQRVGENISDDIKQGAVWAIIISCAMMFLYILLRFRQWQFGLGAVAALFHDVLIVLSFFTIFNGWLPFTLEIDQHFIAAILTVMGYSMTDTVVVFDRIREYLNNNNKTELAANEKQSVINDALNNTLSRTVITSLTIFLTVLAIFLFGGEVIKGFAFALLIGIVIGTYSSICIATPIVVDFDKKK